VDVNREAIREALGLFLNCLSGEIVAVLPDIRPTFLFIGATARADVQLVAEGLREPDREGGGAIRAYRLSGIDRLATPLPNGVRGPRVHARDVGHCLNRKRESRIFDFPEVSIRRFRTSAGGPESGDF
jgi:hypothetical protein